MTNEELNAYIFSEMVTQAAIKVRTSRVNALLASGKITQEQCDTAPQTQADVSEALSIFEHNKRIVFESLAKLQSALPDSLSKS